MMDIRKVSKRFFGIMLLAAVASVIPACSKFSRLAESEKFTAVRLSASSPHRSGLRTLSQAGGVVIWGYSEQHNQSFSLLLTNESDTPPKRLKNGSWSFYAVGWSGSQWFQGSAICGASSTVLNGTDTSLSLALSSAGCSNSFFGPAAPQPLRFVTCHSLSGATDGAQNCNQVLQGNLRSFQVRVPAYERFNTGSSPTILSERVGGCVALGSPAAGNSTQNSTHRLPLGAQGSSPILVTISAYTDTACSTGRTDYAFQSGLRNGSTGGSAAVYPGSSSYVGYSAVYLAHGSKPAPTVTAVSPATGPYGGGTSITITGARIDTSATATVGGQTCSSPTVTGNTSLQCEVPSATDLGAVSVVVTNVDTQTGSLASSFTYADDGFGSGDSGSFTVSSDITDASAASTWGSRPFHAYRNVTNIATSTSGSDVAGATLTLAPSFSTPEFIVGDDVYWHVSAAGSDSDCESVASSPALTPARFGHAKVAAIVSASVLTLDSAITVTPINANIANTNRASGQSFCVIQVVRVPNFQNLTLDSTAANLVIKPPAFSLGSGYGGILVLKARGYLYLHDNAATHSITLDAANKGFAGGASGATGTQGMSHNGTGTSSVASNGSGGGGATSGQGAGGGANQGDGGKGGGGTSNEGTSIATCGPLDQCAAFGAGGGGGTNGALGGAGGGIILVNARSLSLQTFTGAFYLSAAGQVGTAGYAGGGGAGGTAWVQSVESNGIALNQSASGGAGASAGSYTGGGGGGGLAAFAYCSSGTSPTTTQTATGGAPGGGGTPGLVGAAGIVGDSGQASGAAFCP